MTAASREVRRPLTDPGAIAVVRYQIPPHDDIHERSEQDDGGRPERCVVESRGLGEPSDGGPSDWRARWKRRGLGHGSEVRPQRSWPGSLSGRYQRTTQPATRAHRLPGKEGGGICARRPRDYLVCRRGTVALRPAESSRVAGGIDIRLVCEG